MTPTFYRKDSCDNCNLPYYFVLFQHRVSKVLRAEVPEKALVITKGVNSKLLFPWQLSSRHHPTLLRVYMSD